MTASGMAAQLRITDRMTPELSWDQALYALVQEQLRGGDT
jgi:hypothetical protein